MTLGKRFVAEFIGTFWLVFAACGSAVFAAIYYGPDQYPLGIGLLGVSLAFGLTVVTMAYAIGHISGCHLNPAVTIGLVVCGRHKGSDLVPYFIAQTAGAIVAAFVLYFLLSQKEGVDLATATFASNGYGEHSPGGYTVLAGFVAEVLLTFIFLIVILGATDGRAPVGMAGLAIGLALALIHLVGIPITNVSVNPARSTGPALASMVAGTGWPLQQLWLFWVAPLIGGVLAGGFYRWLGSED